MQEIAFCRRTGFTLIELMVVVAIIGILMAAGIVAFSGAQRAARDAQRRADIDAIGKAFEQVYTSTTDYGQGWIWCCGWNSTSGTWNAWLDAINGFFPGSRKPLDPLNNATYNYTISAISKAFIDANYPTTPIKETRFCVYARLEVANGNCTGSHGGYDVATNPNYYRCIFVTPGTGTHYCVQNRQ